MADIGIPQSGGTVTGQSIIGNNGQGTTVTMQQGTAIANGTGVQWAGADFDDASPAFTATFDDQVTDVSFDLGDLDQSSWDDRVRVLAFGGPDGTTPIPITFTDSDTHTVNQDGSSGVLDIEGQNNAGNNGSVITVNIAGPVTSFQVFYEDGTQQSNDPGIIQFTNLEFANVANVAPDAINDTATLDEDTTAVIDVLANDTDSNTGNGRGCTDYV